MEEIEIFLKYPMLFSPRGVGMTGVIDSINNAPNRQITHAGRLNDGTNTPGDPLIWTPPGSKHQQRYYSRPAQLTASRRTEVSKSETKDAVKYCTKVLSPVPIQPTKSSQHWNTNAAFGRAIRFDKQNQVFLNGVPGLEAALKEFTDETQGWWLQEQPVPPGSIQSATQHVNIEERPHHLVPIALSLFEGEELNAGIEKLYDEITKKEFKKYTLKTHEKMGMIGNTDFLYGTLDNNSWRYRVLPCSKPLTLKSWQSKANLEVSSDPLVPYTMSTVLTSLHQDFEVNMTFTKHQDVQLEALLSWVKLSYTSNVVIQERTNQYAGNRSNSYRVKTSQVFYMPVVEGLVMRLTPHDSAETEPNYEHLRRVTDLTKKRKVQGGYRGPYQGVSKIARNDITSFKVELSGGLKAIAKGDPIRSFAGKLNIKPRLPMSKDSYLEIERPMTNVKPLDIGHLELYRVSESPNKQVTGEILSDMQLPSMPELLLSIDSDIRVTSNEDHYINGENCSGTCDKESINLTIAPGLYVVKRKDKCCLGHDPGRGEYNTGFGDLCNEEITIRRLLSKLNVFYDEYRGNMVGSESANQWSEYDTVSSGSLLSRFG